MKFLPLLLLTAALSLRAATVPPPPGVVIHHSPASSGLYIGSPSLCVAPDGSYLASHDYFGPKSAEFGAGRGRLYRSSDKGKTWRHVTDFDGFFWTGLFAHRGKLFLMGTDKHHGNVVIRRSTDSGKTWSNPVVLADGQWHTAPMPVIEHGGRVWRAVEDAHTGKKWGARYRARVMSAPADSDLLDPANWTISSALARDPAWNGGDFHAWLEGNAVAGPEGMLDILRVDTSGVPEKAAIVRISEDGKTAAFDPDTDLVEFPGGSKKFTIRKDPTGPGYWTLASIVPERHIGAGRPASIRNTLALLFSTDLRSWETRCILLCHPDVAKHGFQYVDWQFEGDDMIAACRTAWDDAEGGAHNNHDANFLTFHRWKDFRSLSREDDVAMPEFIPDVHETANLVIRGGPFEIAKLESGAKAFSNRNYGWQDVPSELSGASFTRLPGGVKPAIEVTAKHATVVRIATATGQKGVDVGGWKREPAEFSYTDAGRSTVEVFSRPLAAGEKVHLPGGNWTGPILIFSE
ncbi:glycosylhydrolase [Haloferula helveola]|uniref:Glycosylhydrolase n=1 Tax=Haloferula helveola TaxID=490095 RepID=A0ABN6H4J6_9BACT|nr:glycosylhydrolase [Haloferula helveola]